MGFKVSKEFPNRFVSGDEIGKAIVPVKIVNTKQEIVNAGTKDEEKVLVVYFEGKDRGVRLNKTRANEIKDITGSDDSDGWIGKQMFMKAVPQKAFGEWVNPIHFVKDAGGVTAAPVGEELPTINADEEVNIDDIPF